MASLIEEEIIIPLTNSFEALLDTTEEFLQDHTDESEKDFNVEPDIQDQHGKVGNMDVTNNLNEEGHEATRNSPGGTCHVCIRGCACHVFGSEISLESHIFGSKIFKHECPIFGG